MLLIALRYMQNNVGELTTQTVYDFTVGSESWNSCREYSLNALLLTF